MLFTCDRHCICVIFCLLHKHTGMNWRAPLTKFTNIFSSSLFNTRVFVLLWVSVLLFSAQRFQCICPIFFILFLSIVCVCVFIMTFFKYISYRIAKSSFRCDTINSFVIFLGRECVSLQFNSISQQVHNVLSSCDKY